MSKILRNVDDTFTSLKDDNQCNDIQLTVCHIASASLAYGMYKPLFCSVFVLTKLDSRVFFPLDSLCVNNLTNELVSHCRHCDNR